MPEEIKKEVKKEQRMTPPAAPKAEQPLALPAAPKTEQCPDAQAWLHNAVWPMAPLAAPTEPPPPKAPAHAMLELRRAKAAFLGEAKTAWAIDSN